MKFSQNKFVSLPPLRQLRKIFQLCRRVESAWWRVGAPPAEELHMLRQMAAWTTAQLPQGFHVATQGDAATFLLGVRPLYDSLGHAPDDTGLDILTPERSERDAIPLHVVLVNLRSAFNVGSIIRTAKRIEHIDSNDSSQNSDDRHYD